MTPHQHALEHVSKYAYGDIVEVTHKTPWGFNTLDRTNIHINDYLKAPLHADTTILHNLVGEGHTKRALIDTFRLACRYSKRILVLEHNRDSLDWDTTAFLNETELREITITNRIIRIPGLKDDRRNLLAIKDIR